MLAPMRASTQTIHLQLHRLDTPIGTALLVTDVKGVLRAVDFSDYESRMLKLLRIHYRAFELDATAAPARVEAAFDKYFAGDLYALNDVECETNGTEFQRRIWQTLRAIPVGQTTTYGELAHRLGLANAARAVGLANGANPLAIIVPCHRLIGADGNLTGYAGGLHRKRWLLDHERSRVPVKEHV
jgi:methylated-DNA-[protein]-cysteine S-methyltransferase